MQSQIDKPKLEKTLKAFAKKFGDTSAQAVIRWSVNACRELAFETQVWGKSQTKGKQEMAMMADAYNVLVVVDELRRGKTGITATNQGRKYGVPADRAIWDIVGVNDWIEQNRTRRRGRTSKLPISERNIVSRQIFQKAMRERNKRAGMAKGGWIGAGQTIARAQHGIAKVNIGKNYLSYAQKHESYGTAEKPASGWRPFSKLTNKLAYSSDKNVLTTGGAKRSIDWSLKKTVKWYGMAMKELDKKRTI